MKSVSISLRNDVRFHNIKAALLIGIVMALCYILLSSLEFGIAIIYLFLVGSVAAFVIRKNPVVILGFLIIWLPIQSFVLTLIWQYFNVSVPYMRGLIALKEIVALILLIHLLVTKKVKHFTIVDKAALGYFCICSLYLVLPKFILPNRLGLIPSLASYRTMIGPILIYSIARFTPITNVKLRTLFFVLFSVSILIAGFGLAEYFVLPVSVWQNEINMVGYVTQVHGREIKEWQNAWVPDRFGDRRLKSFFTHPNGASYYYTLIIPLLVVLLIDKNSLSRKKYYRGCLFLMICLFVITQILSLGRGGILAVLAALSILMFYMKKLRLALLPLAILAFIVLGSPIIKRMITGTRERAGIEWALRIETGSKGFIANPLGYGLGQGGLWGQVFSGGKGYIIAGESGYFRIGMQVGLFGLLIFINLLGCLVFYALKNSKRFGPGYSKALLLAVGVSTFALAPFEFVDTLFEGFEIFGTFWLFTGIAVQMVVNRKKKAQQLDVFSSV